MWKTNAWTYISLILGGNHVWNSRSTRFYSWARSQQTHRRLVWFGGPKSPIFVRMYLFLTASVMFPGQSSAVLAYVAMFIAHSFLVWLPTLTPEVGIHPQTGEGDGGGELVPPFIYSVFFVFFCLMGVRLLIITKQVRFMAMAGLVPFRPTPISISITQTRPVGLVCTWVCGGNHLSLPVCLITMTNTSPELAW